MPLQDSNKQNSPPPPPRREMGQQLTLVSPRLPPAQSRVRRSRASGYTLTDMPHEIILQVLKYLPAKSPPRLKGDLVSICLVCKFMRNLALPILYKNIDLWYGSTEGLQPVVIESFLQPCHSGLRYIQHLNVRPRPHDTTRSQQGIWTRRDYDVAVLKSIISRFVPNQLRSLCIIPPVPELIPVLVRTKQRSIRHINLIAPEYYAPNGWYESGLLEGTLKSKKPSTNPENVKHTLIPPEDAKKRDYRCLQNLMHRRPRPNHLRSLDVTLTEAHRSLVTAAALVIANARSLSQIFITGIYSKNGSFNHADASILMTIDTMKQAFARSDSSAYKIPERISLCCVDTLTYHLSQFLSVIDCNNLRSLRFSKCPTAATSLLSGCKYLTGLTELIFDLSGTVKTIQQCLLAIVPNLETLVITTKGSSEHCITAEPIIRHANKLRRIWLEVALEDGQLLSLPAQPSNNDDPSFTWSHVANILNLEELCAPLYHEIPQEIIKGTYSFPKMRLLRDLGRTEEVKGVSQFTTKLSDVMEKASAQGCEQELWKSMPFLLAYSRNLFLKSSPTFYLYEFVTSQAFRGKSARMSKVTLAEAKCISPDLKFLDWEAEHERGKWDLE